MIDLLLVATMVLPLSGAPSAGDVGWLAGCWSLTQGSRTVREHWLPPDGETMMGVGRTVSGGKTAEYEFLIIRQGAKGLEYVAKPSGQAEAIFTATRVSANDVVFENPAHDFPTRIAYSRIDGGLLATISGPMKGKPRTIEFRYKAADCAK